MAKWNECLRAQDALGRDAFVGGAPLSGTWWGATRGTTAPPAPQDATSVTGG